MSHHVTSQRGYKLCLSGLWLDLRPDLWGDLRLICDEVWWPDYKLWFKLVSKLFTDLWTSSWSGSSSSEFSSSSGTPVAETGGSLCCNDSPELWQSTTLGKTAHVAMSRHDQMFDAILLGSSKAVCTRRPGRNTFQHFLKTSTPF